MKNSRLVWALMIILLISCEEGNKNYYSFSENNWKNKDLIKFNVVIDDSTRGYSTNISLRHTTSYKYQNIIMFVHHYFNNNKIEIDTVEIFIAESNGRWKGRGEGDIKEITHRYNNRGFFQKGTHSFELELAMREKDLLQINELDNISDISIYLTRDNE